MKSWGKELEARKKPLFPKIKVPDLDLFLILLGPNPNPNLKGKIPIPKNGIFLVWLNFGKS